MCEYCKIYTDEEYKRIRDREPGNSRIEGFVELGLETISLGCLGNSELYLEMEINEECHDIKAIFSLPDSYGGDCIVVRKEIKYCPMCGRNLTED